MDMHVETRGGLQGSSPITLLDRICSDRASHGAWSFLVAYQSQKQALGIHLSVFNSPELGLQASTAILGFYMGSGDSTQALRNFIHEPSPQLLDINKYHCDHLTLSCPNCPTLWVLTGMSSWSVVPWEGLL